MNPTIELSHTSTPPTLKICADLDCNPRGCHEALSSQPLSSSSFDPLDCTALCSHIPDSTYVVHEDQFIDKVGVE